MNVFIRWAWIDVDSSNDEMKERICMAPFNSDGKKL